MQHHRRFHIDGQRVAPEGQGLIEVINPATEQAVATVAAGGSSDVNRAVAATRCAFETYAWSSREERLDLLDRIVVAYRKRTDELAEAGVVMSGWRPSCCLMAKARRCLDSVSAGKTEVGKQDEAAS